MALHASERNNSENRAEHEFDVTDNDHDGYVTLKEYLEDDFDIDVTERTEKDGGVQRSMDTQREESVRVDGHG